MIQPRRRRHYLDRLSSEINVVPYIDVMLVLLVIFMITAPLLTQGIKVDLPHAKGKDLPSNQQPVIVSVDARGRYYLNVSKTPGKVITAQQLMSQVNRRFSRMAKQPEVYVKGDRAVNYGKVMQAMVLLQKAGASKVGLITQNGPLGSSASS